MNSTKSLFAAALIAFSCITFTYSLKCYVCDSKESCKSAKKFDCTPKLANNTRAYLDLYHIGINPNTTSPYYECFREDIKFSNSELYYKSCTYENIKGCNLALRSFLTVGKYERSCYQCNNKEACNPATSNHVNMMTVFATIVVATLVKFLLH